MVDQQQPLQIEAGQDTNDHRGQQILEQGGEGPSWLTGRGSWAHACAVSCDSGLFPPWKHQGFSSACFCFSCEFLCPLAFLSFKESLPALGVWSRSSEAQKNKHHVKQMFLCLIKGLHGRVALVELSELLKRDTASCVSWWKHKELCSPQGGKWTALL